MVRDHVRLLGALYIAVGAMGVLGALIAGLPTRVRRA